MTYSKRKEERKEGPLQKRLEDLFRLKSGDTNNTFRKAGNRSSNKKIENAYMEKNGSVEIIQRVLDFL